MIRVLLVDDHPVYRDGVRLNLEGWEEVEVIGEAGDGDAAIEAAARLRPNVILMDVQMPGRSGVDATREIVARDPGVAIVVLTMFEDDELVAAAMRAGARGYLLKDAGREELRRAVAAAASGQAIFSASVAHRLTSLVGASPAPPPFPELTPRERDVLELMAQGRLNADIAQRLGLSEKTVRNQVSVIFSKLEVLGRPEAIVKAREAGMGAEGPRP
ncbi:MAG TPA: response regulator transcription factor [Candidatus Limnocylindria bacterium]|nr:response regulator transcription factor [Candidatus Limnocylindria bacterium]